MRVRALRKRLSSMRMPGKILEAAGQASNYRELDLGAGKDAIAFAQTLALERIRRSDLPESLPEAIRILCDERLVEVRKTAAAIIGTVVRDVPGGAGVTRGGRA